MDITHGIRSTIRYKCFTISLVFIFLTSLTPSISQPEPIRINLNDLINNLRTSVKSIDRIQGRGVRSRKLTIKTKQNMSSKMQIEAEKATSFFSAFDGEKELYILMPPSNEKLNLTRNEILNPEIEYDKKWVFDGKDTYMFDRHSNYDKKMPHLMLWHSKSIPFGIRQMCYSLPLIQNSVLDEMEKGNCKFIGSSENSNFGTLYNFTGKYNIYEYNFSLSPKHEYIIIKSEIKFKANFPNGSVIAYWNYNLSTISTIGGHYFPLKAIYEYGNILNGIHLPDASATIVLDKINSDKIDPKLFSSDTGIGSSMQDIASGDAFRIGANNERLLLNGKQTSKRYGFGWLYMASVTTLLVISVGAYVKWKRKQLSKSA